MGFVRRNRSSSILALWIAVIALSADAGPADNWHWRHPFPQGNRLSSVTYGNGLFVSVGGAGQTYVSTNATNWTGIASGFANDLNYAAFVNGRFLAAGTSGAILISTNGTNWSKPTAVTTRALNGAAYGNGTYVTVGQLGTIVTSTNGTDWSVSVSGTTATFQKVAFGHGLFMAVGSGGRIVTSPDGVNWTVRSSITANGLSIVIFADDFPGRRRIRFHRAIRPLEPAQIRLAVRPSPEPLWRSRPDLPDSVTRRPLPGYNLDLPDEPHSEQQSAHVGGPVYFGHLHQVLPGCTRALTAR
jgi:hypothetical protein